MESYVEIRLGSVATSNAKVSSGPERKAIIEFHQHLHQDFSTYLATIFVLKTILSFPASIKRIGNVDLWF